MLSWIQLLFNTDDFPARWDCGLWTPLHGWVHIIADLLIWGAYMAIPLAIVYFLVKRRERLPMARVLWSFGLFIVFCGFGHLIEAGIFWVPVYRFSALIKVCTALVSWATVLTLFPIIPTLLNVPGQESLIKRLKEENSERRKVEESLKVIVEIINQSNDAIVSLDPQCMILSWNGGAHRLYGYGPEEAIGQSVGIILANEEELKELQKAIAIGKEPPTFEARRRPRDGEDIPVSVSISFIKDGFGRLLRISMMDRDITEEKAAESKFERVVESSPNGLIMVNEQGKIVLANARSKSLFGYENQDILGSSIEQLVPPETRRRHVDLRSSFMKAPEERNMGREQELFGQRIDGSQFPVEVGLTPMNTRGQNYVLCTVVDTTERKKAEAELMRAKLSAEAATEAKTQFLANMSHEIRTPLNAIIALSSVSLEEEMSESLEENVRTISRSGEVLLNIVNNILDFSKIEAGEMVLDHRKFQLGVSIEDAFDIVIPNARGKDIEFVYRVDPELPCYFYGDPTKIRQVLVNLLNNAVKFTDTGEIVLTVSGTPDEKANHWRLAFSLEDTGVGIAKDKLDEVLRPFKQAINKLEASGTGLGLSICHKLITLMAGSILLSPSNEGKGTHVTFDLLLEKSDQLEPTQSMQELQVLIIDDYARNRKQFRERFVTWGAVPLTAETAEEALKLLNRKLNLGLIVVDERLLRNNPELLKQLRRPLAAGTPFIVLGRAPNKRPLLKSARVQFVRKPVHWAGMNALVYELINRKNGANNGRKNRQSVPNIGLKVPLKILVAEDHPTNQTVLGLLLRRLGYEAEYTSDGLEAVAAFEKKRHDLVLMDIQMPKLGGVEATKEIREISGASEKPWVVALTANVFGNMKAHYLSSGLNDFVGKPLGLQDIYQAFLRIPEVRNAYKESIEGNSKVTVSSDTLQSVIDWSVLQSLADISEMNAVEFEQLLNSFRTSFETVLISLKSAQKDEDREGYSRAAHTLLGTCTTFGAVSLGALLRLANKNEDLSFEENGDAVIAIGNAYDQFSSALDNWTGHITIGGSIEESRS